MRLRDRIHLLGSGLLGMNSSHELDCNVYLLDGGTAQAIVDCGTGYGVPAQLTELERAGFSPAGVGTVLLTHAHQDHAGGASRLRAATGATVVASPLTAAIVEAGDEEANGLAEARIAGVYPPDCRLDACPVQPIEPGECIRIGDLSLEAIATPGHSADMLSFYCPELKALFCGDAVFAGGHIAALRSPDFSMAALERSVRLLAQYDVDILLPGHLHPVLRGGGGAIAQAVAAFGRPGGPHSIV